MIWAFELFDPPYSEKSCRYSVWLKKSFMAWRFTKGCFKGKTDYKSNNIGAYCFMRREYFIKKAKQNIC